MFRPAFLSPISCIATHGQLNKLKWDLPRQVNTLAEPMFLDIALSLI